MIVLDVERLLTYFRVGTECEGQHGQRPPRGTPVDCKKTPSTRARRDIMLLWKSLPRLPGAGWYGTDVHSRSASAHLAVEDGSMASEEVEERHSAGGIACCSYN